jgi:DNA mismatch repair protein MutS
MMQRYMEVKQETPGAVLLFRMGDFYELFFEDAELAARLLGVTLTSRDKGSPNPIPMAGFPYHQLENYLQRLIQAGQRVAICDQVEDPKTAKGMVRREVTRIVTPGTLTDDSLLSPRESNFIAAIAPFKGSIGLAWLELSTGRFWCQEVREQDEGEQRTARRTPVLRQAGSGLGADLLDERLLDELSRIQPAECLVPDTLEGTGLHEQLTRIDRLLLTKRGAWHFTPSVCEQTLLKHFGVTTLEGFDVEGSSAGVTAAGVLLGYVQETQRSHLRQIIRLERYQRSHKLLIDETTRRSLELTRTQRDGSRTGSLLDTMDETVTPMGARLLAEWLSNPLTEIRAINRRLDAVEELVGEPILCRELRELQTEAYDLQRLAARAAALRASPRDLDSLARTLALLPRLKAKLSGRRSDLLRTLETRLDLCAEVRVLIEQALSEEPPIAVQEGGIFRKGYHAQLDELRELARGGKQWIAEYQAREIQRTGIGSLKVGFNKVFGYYLEVTAANRDKVPADYQRKQTLKNQERYITPELKEYEDKVLRAEERSLALEAELFQQLREAVGKECRRLLETADVLAQVDVLVGLATLASKQRYCRPKLVSEPILVIREGRHPVLDRLRPAGEFVPNDTVLGLELSEQNGLNPEGDGGSGVGRRRGYISLLTGPNMAGKSTYIRQSALIVIMAQLGSFVPATEATVGVADRVFARVGASDELGKGQSTFMVEMTETARILNTATERSLVILDEIGRGTSTYDGISLAWAITEYLHDEVRCRTLFATHYHELTELPKTLPGVKNWNVAVHEQDGEVRFLHRIVPGAADRSYGIHVARLAGVPREVVARADVILEQLESDHRGVDGKPTVPPRSKKKLRQRSLFEEPAEPHPVLNELRAIKIEELTPLKALQELARMQGELG